MAICKQDLEVKLNTLELAQVRDYSCAWRKWISSIQTRNSILWVWSMQWIISVNGHLQSRPGSRILKLPHSNFFQLSSPQITMTATLRGVWTVTNGKLSDTIVSFQFEILVCQLYFWNGFVLDMWLLHRLRDVASTPSQRCGFNTISDDSVCRWTPTTAWWKIALHKEIPYHYVQPLGGRRRSL